MSNRNDGGNAFPFFDERCMNSPEWGMTIRDYFAAKALHVVAERFNFRRDDFNGSYIAVESFESIASDAYLMADAMLAERAK